jgi:hypothetical protein
VLRPLSDDQRGRAPRMTRRQRERQLLGGAIRLRLRILVPNGRSVFHPSWRLLGCRSTMVRSAGCGEAPHDCLGVDEVLSDILRACQRDAFDVVFRPVENARYWSALPV